MSHGALAAPRPSSSRRRGRAWCRRGAAGLGDRQGDLVGGGADGRTNSAITAETCGSPSRMGSAWSYVSAVAEPSMSTGSRARLGRQHAREPRGVVAERRELQPGSVARVRAEDPEPAGVRQDRDAPALQAGRPRAARRCRSAPRARPRGSRPPARTTHRPPPPTPPAQRCGSSLRAGRLQTCRS